MKKTFTTLITIAVLAVFTATCFATTTGTSATAAMANTTITASPPALDGTNQAATQVAVLDQATVTVGANISGATSNPMNSAAANNMAADRSTTGAEQRKVCNTPATQNNATSPPLTAS